MDIFNEIVKQIDLEGNIYEVAIVRVFEVMEFTIDVEASKTTPYQLNENVLTFEHDFIISQISTQAETNALAGFLVKLNGVFIPSESYFLDASNKLATQPLGVNTKGFWCTTSVRRYPHLDYLIKAKEQISFYVYNTHSADQELYINLFGYRLYKKVLKRTT